MVPKHFTRKFNNPFFTLLVVFLGYGLATVYIFSHVFLSLRTHYGMADIDTEAGTSGEINQGWFSCV